MVYFTAVGPLLTPAFVPLAQQFNVPLQRFTLGELDASWFHHWSIKLTHDPFIGCNGSCIVAIAFGSLLCNTLAVKVGRRPVYLITTLGLAVSCFWAAESTSFPSLAAARAIQGLCMGMFIPHIVEENFADVQSTLRGTHSSISRRHLACTRARVPNVHLQSRCPRWYRKLLGACCFTAS